ncbi:MAG: hypothetical protein DWI11_03340 [Planctomycetota bacterium]|nr:MAG: hypothetical protein DWI11_03340 [Planctomycetota bacterium]
MRAFFPKQTRGVARTFPQRKTRGKLAENSRSSRVVLGEINLVNDVETESVQPRHRVVRAWVIRQESNLPDAEVAKNLPADAEGSTIHRLRAARNAFGSREIWRVHIIVAALNPLQTRRKRLADSLWSQIHNCTATFFLNRAHRSTERVTG